MASTTSISSEDVNVRPCLHILRLTHGNNNDDNEGSSTSLILNFRTPTYLDDTTTTTTTDTPTTGGETAIRPKIKFGDIIFFIDQLTGAGEMESCRLVGKRSDENNRYFELLNAGIEAPVFPNEIVNTFGVNNLRTLYKPLLDAVLNEQDNGMCLADLFGGDDVEEEFWSQPDTSSTTNRTDDDDDTANCIIRLQDCIWINTISST